ncbi:BglG family transcription antiterminator LicT [Pectobacterium fontis]|uniref:Transcription antiterminator LicT n=1 Tax=Pectobacterium fontis TaxID=2558042 RepID=A0A7V8IH12_9GAMM|nr:PRD domain-containing protein [Pectobacterium fontis]KHN50358.1 transcription antiterminator LicT [Pectobacterium fontis]
MKVEKILSNNAVLLINENREEIVAIGRGIGFGKKQGDDIDASQIESQFVKSRGGLTEVFSQLLAEIPPAHLAVTQQIITLAQQKLAITAQDTLFLALSDHINFAIQRHSNGLEIRNFLLWDIKRFYASEFLVGMEALSLINDKLHVSLPEDEAGFIALHLANARNNSDMQSTMQSATLIKDILSIVQYDLRIKYDETSLDYQRFITHLKFFALRLLNREEINHKDNGIYEGIKELMQDAYACARKVYDYVEINYECQLTTDEIMFLTIHINRLRKD